MNDLTQNTMPVEIWSDVMCPFCYIGKRNFETALAQFANRNQVAIIWKSFQLNPNQETIPDKSVQQHLAEQKGITLSQAQQMTRHVTALAQRAGLTFHFDRAVTANSFDAHRLSHLAKQQGVQHELEEELFAAYFTDGKNTADPDTLIQLGQQVGLPAGAIQAMLQSGQFADAVQTDIHEARQLGVQGVPFFVFNRKYAVSGAQESAAFLEALHTAFADWEKAVTATPLVVADGDACTTDGNCD